MKFEPGDRVIVQKGAWVKSTHPRWPTKGRYCKRDTEVIVRTIRVDNNGKPVQITWAGTGGYWKWCSTEHIRPAPTDLERLAKEAPCG